MSSKIPTWARLTVRERCQSRCERCNGRGAEWHHRRTRAVRDAHSECPCNGVWLCGDCHRWAHAHPIEARSSGWIISRHQTDPGVHPVYTVWGTRWHDCEGGAVYEQAP